VLETAQRYLRPSKEVAVERPGFKFAIGGLVIDSGALGIVGQGQLGIGIGGDGRLKEIEMLQALVMLGIPD
jgi:hypothetical protein